ncbi:MAG: hypothetical protein U9O83_01130 [Campylobacterota bacterium]|nr:hypothetical protein [Campylobacterota bacterium]
MISRKNEVKKVYDYAEYSIELDTVHKLVDELVDKIKTLESICDELIELPKGVESHSWSDYKSSKI